MYLDNNCKYLLALLVCCSQSVFGQQTAVDSLVKALGAHSIQDTLRLQMLNDLAWNYRTVDPGKGLLAADEAIGLGRQLNDKGRLASAYNAKAWNYSSLGEDSTALTLFSQAWGIRAQMRDTTGMAKIRYNMGTIYFNLSDYPRAMAYQQEALLLFIGLRDTTRMANCYNSIGLTYQYLSDYSRALETYQRSLAIYERHSDKPGLGATLTNMGILYKNMNKLDKALEYQQKALDVYTQLDDKQGMAKCLGNIGVVYDQMNRPAQSLPFFARALDLCRSIDYRWGIASNLSNMGTAYASLGKYSEALTSMQQALDIWRHVGDRNNESEMLGEMGRIYMAHNYAKADSLLHRSLALAQEIGAPDKQQMAWEYLAQLYEKKKDFARALAAYKQAALFEDSILNTEKEKEITRKEMQYDFERKEAAARAVTDKQQALAAAEISRQRVIRNAIGAGAGVLLLAGSLTFAFYRKKRESEYRRRVAETEMKALRAQMNPHFIFNSLNSISDFITKNDLDTADLYLTRFATLMRMVLENSGRPSVSLAEDLKALEIYIQLECMRMNHAFTYEILVDASIDREMTMVPPLLLQPFVENSIWHGIAGKGSQGKIIIRVEKEEASIYCTVEDNGAGRKNSSRPVPDPKRKSFGMKITASRIAMINNYNHGPASLEITDLEEGVKVGIRLPLELHV